jgi:hypothetical protein
LDLKLSPLSVWGQLRDFRRYAAQDLFHAEIKIEGGLPRAGAVLRLSHRYCGLRVPRHGRILFWREGVGFSFSDLSFRGPRHGFPHVFTFRIEPLPNGTRLQIRVTGLWTPRFCPRQLARLWLLWVFRQVVRCVHNELLIYQFWRERVHRVSSANS